MSQDLHLLNPQQRQAVEKIRGRLLILAGAGSGKTRVLTTRMAYLINFHKISPKAILGLTFTNKAAAEMRHRLASLVDPSVAKQVTLSTFHSFCMQILRRDIHHLGYTSEFSLYDEQDVQRLVNAISRDLLQNEGELPSLAPTVQVIRQANNKGEGPSSIKGTSSDWHDEFAQQVFTRLKASMRAYNAVDFDHLLSLTVELFENFPSVLEFYQERFQFIMIDEYQDTNPIQYRLAALLSKKYNNLCVVGDDDQSIYGWRGAEIQNILNFEDATVIKLEQNYRSTNAILKAANEVIRKNKTRHDKVLWSDKGEGDLIEVFCAPNELEEAQAVVNRIMKIRENQGLKWKDFAILYRSNSLSRQFETALMKTSWKNGNQWMIGIPYEVWGSVEFYERREVKDLLAYLRVIVNPLDQEALLRIVNQPRRGIGEDSLDSLTSYNRKNGKALWDVMIDYIQNPAMEESVSISTKAKKGLEDFLVLMSDAKEKFVKGNLADALKWLVEKINYKKAIHEEVKSQQMRDFKWENVQEFINSLVEFERQSEGDEGHFEGSLASFTANLALDQKGMHASKKGDDKINLMTIHSSKGLEFPVCFLVGAEDRIIPHEKSGSDIEEERRLMYVAVTRARSSLTISFAKERIMLGKPSPSRPSRFLNEIPKDLIRVTDYKWG